eukprot:scaffold156825_cov30-Tisochrysis_lutea.AAC.4
MSAFTTPRIGSIMRALVMTVSRASSALQPVAWPMPSRSTFPPPNFSSSPYTVKSFSTSANRQVSPSLMRSPTVGPNMAAYSGRLRMRGVPFGGSELPVGRGGTADKVVAGAHHLRPKASEESQRSTGRTGNGA